MSRVYSEMMMMMMIMTVIMTVIMMVIRKVWINPIIMDIHDWIMDIHNKVLISRFELSLWISIIVSWVAIITGDPLHSRAACTQPCNVNTHSRAHCSPGARLCEQWGHGCVNNGARLCASARLCRGSPVIMDCHNWTYWYPHNRANIFTHNAIMDIHNCCKLCISIIHILVFLFFGNTPPPPPPPKKKKKDKKKTKTKNKGGRLSGSTVLSYYHYAFTASQQMHDANNVITSKQC